MNDRLAHDIILICKWIGEFSIYKAQVRQFEYFWALHEKTIQIKIYAQIYIYIYMVGSIEKIN